MGRASAPASVDRRWQRLPDDRPRVLMTSALKLLKRDGYRRVRHEDIARRVVSAGGSASDRLRLFLEDFWTNSLTAQSGLWQRMVVGEMATEAPDVFAAWAKGLVQRWKFVEQLIVEGQESGEFRADADAPVAARLIISGLAQQAVLHVHLGVRRFAPLAIDRLFDSSFKLLLDGVRRRARD
jgi:hypothetical protein